MAGDRGSIDPVFAQKLNALVGASGGRVTIGNSYRSTATQQKLWDAALKKYGSPGAARKWVAPPGKSNHQAGVAADLRGDVKWAAANAARFGLWFPMGHEPWHVELAGSRSGKESQTTAPVHGHGPGDPNAMDALGATAANPEAEAEQKRRGTIEGQLANLLAAMTVDTEDVGGF